jgi:methylmalonyl-CoA mutase N-terminal domain/subunit
LKKGLDINVFAKRLSFFFNCHNNFFEEIAKFRAARRMWAHITKGLGATDAGAQKLRFHTQTGGSTLTAQQPLNNIIRVSNQALAAVLGGTQSLHTNGYDEALSLPTEAAAKIALRTQQIIAFESGVTDTVDPLAGSYFIEALTNEIEAAAQLYLDKIDAMGGAVKAIEQDYIQQEIAASAYQYQNDIESGDKILVGVNKFTQQENAPSGVFRVDDSIRKMQIEKITKLKNKRNGKAVEEALQQLRIAAKGTENLMPFIVSSVENYATLGEIADILREVFGEY